MTGKDLLCLGIESTAHTFGVAIVTEKGQILSDIKDVYVPSLGKGIHPREAAEHHGKCAPFIIKKALDEAKKTMKEINLIAFSKGPGLGPSLRIGATLARSLAIYFKKPIVPVNHAIGHIEIGALTTGAKDPLLIMVSGGHTALAAFANMKWRIFGETEDITIGNLLDMFAREMELPSPGGKSIEKLANKGKNLIDLPYSVKGNDVVYSGLLTAALNKKNQGVIIDDLCFSLQEISFSMLSEATERCLAHTEKTELLLAGGVAANKRLQEMLTFIAHEHNATFYVVDKRFSADCGAQIAWAGLLSYKSGISISIEDSFVQPKWRLDDVDIPWR